MKKYKIIKLSFSLAVVFVSTGLLQAQIPEPPNDKVPENTVSLLVKSFGDSIVLRWAPNSIDAWLEGNSKGYNIIRYKVVENEKTVIENPVRQIISEGPLTPLDIETIERYYRYDKYAAIVAQAIYGSSFNMDTQTENMSFLNMAEELSNRYSFALFACDMSINAAKSHGLYYADKQIEPGAKYVYCIKPNWNDTISRVDSAFTFVAVSDTFPVPSPVQPFARFEDKTVEISWDVSSTEGLFSAYHIERSSDNGNSYTRINNSPIINTVSGENTRLKRMMFVDSIPAYETEYLYRIRGITPFGEVSPPSDIISGKGKKILIGVNPMIVSSERLEGPQLKIKWEFPSVYDVEIKGFVIERSIHAEGNYQKISDTLAPSLREFTDNKPSEVNYYQVCAISQAGYTYCSFPSLVQLPDSIPPAPPVGLIGSIDSLGVVTLNWNKNSESDLYSYKVYRSNQVDDGFVPIHQGILVGTFLTDTVPLNNLNNKVFYAVSAQDRNYNESAKSRVLTVIKPDTIPPVSPRITGFNSGPSSISLSWMPSSSLDVDKHLLYRRQESDREWELLTISRPDQSIQSYTDSSLAMGSTFVYLLIAVDQAGLESISNQAVTVRTSLQPGEDIPLKVKLIESSDGKSITLKWEGYESPIDRILIYKAVDDQKPTLLRTVQASEKQYIDSVVKPGHSYSYRLQAITSTGMRFRISKPQSITL